MKDQGVIERFVGWLQWSALVFATLFFILNASVAFSQTASQSGLDRGQYIPNVWVDPDGCEHWVMDDGIEGYMTPHVDRNGIPVCRDGNVCALVRTDAFFASGSFDISAEGVSGLQDFFRRSDIRTFSIVGHTDSTGSDAFNMKLSRDRAKAVADIARSTGARITSVRGYGARKPSASNATEKGRAKNRRVEIVCVR